MFDILDTPQHTTLERAREAIRFGGINLSDVVRYLESGSPDDRLAQGPVGDLTDLRVPIGLLLAALSIHALICLFLVW